MPDLEITWLFYSMTLNAAQQSAVHYTQGPLLVIAGAGSGKTRVITHKILHLIERVGVPAHKIVAVTFTNKTAREMKERVSQLLPKSASRGLTVSTFHQLGLNILRQEHKKLGLKSGFSILDEQDVKQLVQDSLAHLTADDNLLGLIQHSISQWKNERITPEQAIQTAQEPTQLQAAHAYQTYQRLCRTYNAVDFDDLILLPTLVFETHPEVQERWQNRVMHLLVDEYQDTNSAQYFLIRQLTGVLARFTVVGDDDQSIYAWRGARTKNLEILQQDYPQLKVVMLEQNYRSTQRILNSANAVIKNNPHLFQKNLWSQSGIGDPVLIRPCKNEEGETDFVANEILSQKLRFGRAYKDFAVLYRSNHQARLLEIKLQALQIPYRISGGTSFFARTEIKTLMAYLRLLVNPDDDNAFLRIINTPPREIGASTLEKIGQYAQMRGISMLLACQEFGLQQQLSTKSHQRVQHFSDWFEQTTRACEESNSTQAIRQLLSDVDYSDWIRNQSSQPKTAERRIANVEQLLTSLGKMLNEKEDEDDSPKKNSPAEKSTLEKAIAQLVLRDILEQQNEEQETDKVSLMTLHAAKGLEFENVFLMGIEEEILPHKNSIEADSIEEERRLFYVGITRAQKNLTLTYSLLRTQYGEKFSPTPSRFLDELPADEIMWERQDQAKPRVEQEAIANAHLSNLRQMLGK